MKLSFPVKSVLKQTIKLSMYFNSNKLKKKGDILFHPIYRQMPLLLQHFSPCTTTAAFPTRRTGSNTFGSHLHRHAVTYPVTVCLPLAATVLFAWMAEPGNWSAGSFSDSAGSFPFSQVLAI